jgi:hypothetical protein
MKSGILSLLFLSYISLTSVSNAQSGQVNYQLYNLVLKEYTKLGKIKYKELSADSRLSEVVKQFSKVNPDDIKSSNDKLAFWINVYNSSVLKIICDNYPVKSINDLNSGIVVLSPVLGRLVWDKKIIRINNNDLSLTQIEHIITTSDFKDPRAHFAIVYGAAGCPPLRDEAYIGGKLSEQLNEQARIYINDTTKNTFKLKIQSASISRIFESYEKEFGLNKKSTLVFLANFLPKNMREDILTYTDRWEVSIKSFDWSLNTTKWVFPQGE